MLPPTNYKLQASGGYTLVELMIAISIFAVVMGIMSSMLVTSLRGQRKIFTSQNMNDNVRYAMEMMSKEIRMGKDFSVSNIDSCIACKIQFTSTMPNRSGQLVEFYLDSSTGQVMFDDYVGNGPSADPVTSLLNISVSFLRFDITGNLPNSQTRITIVMRASSIGTADNVKTSMDIQTTISPRKL